MPATRKKKKFIDKKNSVTFHLVHRSQKDPLQADDDAGQHVLLPQQGALPTSSVKERRDEQHKFGVFFDDDYNYMQHLRDVDELYQVAPMEANTLEETVRQPKIQLPSTVFASKAETGIGLLNKAVRVTGPQPDWDPDIVAALDDDFDLDNPDNLLEDDFILQANDKGKDTFKEDDEEYDSEGSFASDEAEGGYDSDDAEGEKYDTFDPDRLQFADEETKSRFTDYSISSSVIRRNEGLTLLDDRFEKLFNEYDEDAIGALDQEEIDGYMAQNSDLLNDAMQEFEKKYAEKRTLKDVVEPATEQVDILSGSDSDDEQEFVKMVMEEKPEKAWDCESIISTYSNIYNHPTKIHEPRKHTNSSSTSRKMVNDEPELTRQQIEKDLNRKNTVSKNSTRPQNETPEEKKLRKQAVKMERRERRVEKKMTRAAFQQEERRQEKEQYNLQHNLRGIKLS